MLKDSQSGEISYFEKLKLFRVYFFLSFEKKCQTYEKVASIEQGTLDFLSPRFTGWNLSCICLVRAVLT